MTTVLSLSEWDGLLINEVEQFSTGNEEEALEMKEGSKKGVESLVSSVSARG